MLDLARGGGMELPRPDLIYALTSLSPSADVAVQRAAVLSWVAAGLAVRSFNHPSEIATLEKVYVGVEFVPVEATSIEVFGRHYIPINAMLRWARDHDAPVLLVNADIELRLAPWEMKRLRWLSDGGLCWFVRHNHGPATPAAPEKYGIDAFLLHGRDVDLFPDSFLSMGQPSWDYWLPFVFASHSRPVHCVEFPAAFHAIHPRRWSTFTWSRCVLELSRVAGIQMTGHSHHARLEMTRRVRASFNSHPRLGKDPGGIREWVERTFGTPAPKLFLELGAHRGDDTAWLSAIPGVTMHAFEPDPRNTQPEHPNVTVHQLAIAAADGVAPFILSARGWGKDWTYSSSLKLPKNHLRAYPVTFGDTIEVHTTSLDAFRARAGVDLVDFLWMDVQGAELDVLRGARETLTRTRFVYTEWSDDELYEGQGTLSKIMATLPEWRVLEMWPGDVLLANRRFE